MENEAVPGLQNGPLGGVPQSSSFMQGQDIDYNHPLFLGPIDVSELSLIYFQLLGIENYTSLSRSIRLALLEQNKIRLIDGSARKEVFGVELWGQMERVNFVVLSWLMNSVFKSLLNGITFAFSALNVWVDLKERFDRVDRSRTYSLHKYIASLQQTLSLCLSTIQGSKPCGMSSKF
ncbi:hypothetical protein RDI58_029257 [Solanum bulbocastanum]|uniref:Uncharacterized protein n=1 Tax=Solanum bulbocastanum TaxID=147425 RepID=A0AAN8SRB4_SOLBU